LSKNAPKGGTRMLNRLRQIVLDKHTLDPKTMMRQPMARKDCRAIAYHFLPGWLRVDSGMPTSCASGCRTEVPVDNRRLCRLDYRVAEVTTNLYARRIHTGGSFPPNVRASSPLVSPLAAPTGLARNMSRAVQRFADFCWRRASQHVVHMMAEMNQ